MLMIMFVFSCCIYFR